MRLPFKGLYIFTQDFGANPENYVQFGLKGHDGLDFGCPTRTEIVAPHNGVVIEANFDAPGYGWYVKIENDVEGSVIAHLDVIDVQVGFKLNEGDHIGWSDNTGNSTGPHCHFGHYPIPRNRSNGFAGFEDQKPLLAKAGIHLTLGQLPEVAAVAPVESSTSDNTYKGLDINNPDSVRAAIDAWYDVANGKYKTAEEYQALQQQLDSVKRQLTDTQVSDSNISSELKNYNEMKALGYNTIDDINSVLKKQDDTVLSLQKENAILQQRVGILAGEIEKISTEDHTTATLGQQSLDENKQLKETIAEITKVTGADKPSLTSIVDKIFNTQDMANRFIKLMDAKQKQQVKPVAIISTIPTSTLVTNKLLQLFRIIP